MLKKAIKTVLPTAFIKRVGYSKHRTTTYFQQTGKRLFIALAVFRTGYHYRLSIGEFGPFSVAYRVGTADENVINHSFENDIFFSGIPEYIPEPNHTIMDVGAHIGTFTILAASKVKLGRVYALEASRETYDFLRINVSLNHLENVVTSHIALTDRSGKTILHHDLGTGNWGHSIMK